VVAAGEAEVRAATGRSPAGTARYSAALYRPVMLELQQNFRRVLKPISAAAWLGPQNTNASFDGVLYVITHDCVFSCRWSR
jgi:hypothetical protein